MKPSRLSYKLMDISTRLWIFLDVQERYGRLLERESLQAVEELYKRRIDELDLGVFLVVILNQFHDTIFIIPHFV